MTLDLLFPVLGDSLPTDHSYLLFAAASIWRPSITTRASHTIDSGRFLY
jgi:hypothetical protein